MVRNKGRHSFRQYIKDKPTKWGLNFWVLADAINGYTFDFHLYLWKQDAISTSGLGYTVVMILGEDLFNQGYRFLWKFLYKYVIIYLCKRRSKIGNRFQKLDEEQPILVNYYNKYMTGVDRSDQIIGIFEEDR